MDHLREKEKALENVIDAYQKPCIAFSGGVDSTLLMAVTSGLKGKDCVAITANGVMMPDFEMEEIHHLVSMTGIEHHIIEMDILDVDDFKNNTPLRCYSCKKQIFGAIQKAAKDLGCDVIFDGSNVDDLSDYRPGMKALEELCVVSPFLNAKFTKSDIRALSREMGLMTADKPALACIATRIPTGTPITKEKIAAVEDGETLLRELNLTQYRLRHLGETARIECAPEDFEIILAHRKSLVDAIKKLGFKTVVLDLSAYSKGAMNNYESQ